MKKISTIILIFICAFAPNLKSFATVHTINVSSFQFAPNSVTAVTGDTVRWVWVNGSHTTTCDGSQFTSLPAGAASWNSNINSNTTMFEYVLTAAGAYAYKCVPHGGMGMVGVLTVSVGTSIVTTPAPPVNHLDILTSAYNSKAEIKYYIPSDGKVNLSIYDLTGKKVGILVDMMLPKGEYTNEWDAINAPQGTYLCRLESKDLVLTRKFIIRK